VTDNFFLFLQEYQSKAELDNDDVKKLKSFLTLDEDLSGYLDLYKKHKILDDITSELYLKRATDNQVKSLLEGYIPVKYEDYPLIVFLILKNYRSHVKELYHLLRKFNEDFFKNIVQSPYFQGKYLTYLTKIMKNNAFFVSALIAVKDIDHDILEILVASSDPEVLFRISNLKHKLIKDKSLIKQALSNPYTPDDAVVLLKQLLYEINLEHEAWNYESDRNNHEKAKKNENVKVAVESEVKELEENLYKKVLAMKPVEKIKLALKGNKSARSLLIKDPNKQVALSVLKNPRITEEEIETLVKNKTTPEHLIREITRNRNLMKNYNILKSILMHPKTPLEISMKYVNNLYMKDIEILSKSREIPAALKNQATRLYLTKSGKR